MPYSLVFNLVPRSPIYPDFLSGRHLHALFLTLVSSVDRSLANALHGQTTHKSFTLSPLQVVRRQPEFERLQWQYGGAIPAGTPCWWRVGLLDEGLFGELQGVWLGLSGGRSWHLGAADLEVVSVLGTRQGGQPWVNACGYEELFELASERERVLELVFATPTAFRQGNFDTSMPTKELVFRSLLDRWNRYSSIQIPAGVIESVFPSFFDLRTEIMIDSRSKLIGCVGRVEYRILGEVDALTIRRLNALADFAVFAGVGRKTTMGMGMSFRKKEEGKRRKEGGG